MVGKGSGRHTAAAGHAAATRSGQRPAGRCGGGGAGLDARLLKPVFPVFVHRAWAQAQDVAHVARGVALGHSGQQLAVSRGPPVPLTPRRRRLWSRCASPVTGWAGLAWMLALTDNSVCGIQALFGRVRPPGADAFVSRVLVRLTRPPAIPISNGVWRRSPWTVESRRTYAGAARLAGWWHAAVE